MSNDDRDADEEAALEDAGALDKTAGEHAADPDRYHLP